MSVAIFFLLAVIVGAVLVWPLLPGRMSAKPVPVVTDGDIEQVVRRLRQRRSRSGQGGPTTPERILDAKAKDLTCPACGQVYRVGDHFCVRCGGVLPQPTAASTGRVCPSCGTTVGERDGFCAKCGQKLAAEEVA
jgi:predicted RNA-binding Zn-ribbon protein involved in translation (DUF1610 family)